MADVILEPALRGTPTGVLNGFTMITPNLTSKNEAWLDLTKGMPWKKAGDLVGEKLKSVYITRDFWLDPITLDGRLAAASKSLGIQLSSINGPLHKVYIKVPGGVKLLDEKRAEKVFNILYGDAAKAKEMESVFGRTAVAGRAGGTAAAKVGTKAIPTVGPVVSEAGARTAVSTGVKAKTGLRATLGEFASAAGTALIIAEGLHQIDEFAENPEIVIDGIDSVAYFSSHPDQLIDIVADGLSKQYNLAKKEAKEMAQTAWEIANMPLEQKKELGMAIMSGAVDKAEAIGKKIEGKAKGIVDDIGLFCALSPEQRTAIGKEFFKDAGQIYADKAKQYYNSGSEIFNHTISRLSDTEVMKSVAEFSNLSLKEQGQVIAGFMSDAKDGVIEGGKDAVRLAIDIWNMPPEQRKEFGEALMSDTTEKMLNVSDKIKDVTGGRVDVRGDIAIFAGLSEKDRMELGKFFFKEVGRNAVDMAKAPVVAAKAVWDKVLGK